MRNIEDCASQKLRSLKNIEIKIFTQNSFITLRYWYAYTYCEIEKKNVELMKFHDVLAIDKIEIARYHQFHDFQ